MTARIEVALSKDGWKTVWRTGTHHDQIDVDVFNPAGEKVLEWTYGKVVGPSVMGNAAFWLEQVLLQAGKKGRPRAVRPDKTSQDQKDSWTH